MAFELRDMTGNLFNNSYKESESDNRPDLTGIVKVNGNEYDIAGWTREGKNSGNKYISIKVSEKGDYEGKKPQDAIGGSKRKQDNLPF